MKRILSTVAVVALVAGAFGIADAHAADGARFVFRWKAGVVSPVGVDAGGSGDTSETGGGSGTETGTGGADGSADGSGDGGESSDPGETIHVALSGSQIQPDASTRAFYQANMAFEQPLINAPAGDYKAGDAVHVCWQIPVSDPGGLVLSSIEWLFELPPSPLVSAVVIDGVRYSVDPDAGEVSVSGNGEGGCADLEIALLPDADSYGWGMGIPFGVTAKADTYYGWYWGWGEPDAYEVQHDSGPSWWSYAAERRE